MGQGHQIRVSGQQASRRLFLHSSILSTWRPLALFVTSYVLVACSPEAPKSTSNGNGNTQDTPEQIADFELPSCDLDDLTYFNDYVYTRVFNHCAGCHNPSGSATANGADLVIYEGDVNASFTAVTDYINDGNGELLRNKPSENGVTHSGGKFFAADSQVYDSLEELAIRLGNTERECELTEQAGFFRDLHLLDHQQTLRKASLLFAGRPPTENEKAQVVDDASLKQTLMGLMNGDAFEAFLMEGANDRLLTLKYANDRTPAFDELGAAWGLYPQLTTRFDNALAERDAAETAHLNDPDDPELLAAYEAAQNVVGTVWRETNQALAEEPLRLIHHVVSNDRPYSEILTADYVMMNPYSHSSLNGITGKGINFDDDTDVDEWREANIEEYLYLPEGQTHLPAAGILTSPVFLARYPSTDTNRNRARARWAYYFFLGLDIEGLAVRAMDPDELAMATDPGDPNTTCSGCHQTMDPFAGAFQNWGDQGHFKDNDGEHSLPDTYVFGGQFQMGDTWYRDNLAPGFNGTAMPTVGDAYKEINGYVDGLQWLAQHMVSDDRFATGTIKFWYPTVFGLQPLNPPTETSDADFQAKSNAYQGQQTLINELAEDFRGDNLNLKSLFADMAMSPLFRATGADDLSAERQQELHHVGFGRLLTPEQLSRKVTALLGQKWSPSWNPEASYFTEDYYQFYGGINSDDIAVRATELNSLMARVVLRFANEIACGLILDEMNTPAMDRLLFPLVEGETVPASHSEFANISNSAEVIDEAAIVANIQHLHEYLLGEELPSTNDEIQQTLALFTALWQQRMDGTYSNFLYSDDDQTPEPDEFCTIDWDALNWDNIDWNNRADIKDHIGHYYNPEQTIRAWTGVLVYLLTDYRFIYH